LVILCSEEHTPRVLVIVHKILLEGWLYFQFVYFESKFIWVFLVFIISFGDWFQKPFCRSEGALITAGCWNIIAALVVIDYWAVQPRRGRIIPTLLLFNVRLVVFDFVLLFVKINHFFIPIRYYLVDLAQRMLHLLTRNLLSEIIMSTFNIY
jgi:hypothetical protein